MRMSRPQIRVLLDANILISYLLAGDRPATVVHLVETIISGPFTLLVSQELMDELAHKVQTKSHLVNRIDSPQLQRLINSLRLLSEWVDLGRLQHPRVVRDRNDDYLIALATIGRADFLVTGDRDLLELDVPLPFRIVRIRDILAELEDD